MFVVLNPKTGTKCTCMTENAAALLVQSIDFREAGLKGLSYECALNALFGETMYLLQHGGRLVAPNGASVTPELSEENLAQA